jgi:Putative Flp pilus-assembly TadE/G-like
MLRNLVSDKRGGIALVMALTLPVYLGGAALAIDTIQWSLAKRQMQRQADSGALAGAFGLAQGSDVIAVATSDLQRNNFVALTSAPVIENAPLSGPLVGNNRAVRVALSTVMRLPFSSLFIDGTTISAEATAQMVGQGEYCVIALDRGASTGIDMGGNTNVDLGCGMISNGVSANAIEGGNPTAGTPGVNASPIAAVGGIPASANYVPGTSLFPYAVPQSDPYATLPDPVIGSGTKYGGEATMVPGTYSKVDIKGTVTMAPGEYYINGGDFSLGSQAVVNGTGVVIILTSNTAASNPSSIAGLNINAGATVNLTAPTGGTYAGVLFYQDRRAVSPENGNNKTNIINGNSSSVYQGAIYFPKQPLQFNGTAGMTTNCLRLVAWRIKFTGDSEISNVCPSGSGVATIPGTVIKLVA